MGVFSRNGLNIPDQQQAIRNKCFHPTGTFVEFRKEDVEKSIPARFEEQAGRHPDRLAVQTKNHRLTYNELNNAANRVAWAILGRQQEAQAPISLLFQQGAQSIVGILGVLKAGKTVVPLDPSLPRARMDYIVENSTTGLILTDGHNHALARELAHSGRQILNIDDLGSSVSAGNSGLSISPGTLSWIIYTSGSTGQPKGVVHTHRNVLHNVMNYTNEFHICADDRLTLLHSFSVSSGMVDIFCALLNGAALYPFTFEEKLVNIARWLTREKMTIFNWSPTPFRNFVGILTGKNEFPELRLVVLGSEPVSKRDVELHKIHFSADSLFVNRLGTTETNNFRLYFVDKETEVAGNNVPAGYALRDKEVLLLGDSGKEIGFDEIGEIAVRSRYISLGYWRRPDLSQASFLPDPDGGDQRIYLTGDRGRILPDGCLEHLGRKDFQVKIRGYRVEVAEVEMALLDRSDIHEAVVVALEDRPGNPRLVAYVVAAGQPAPTIPDLRSLLQETLPEYMIPSAFVYLDALPTLPNGKLNRRELPAPGSARPDLGTVLVASRTPAERALLQVWADVLGLDEIGVHDNFLELGGDSLLAGQVISRVISEFRVDLPLRSLFRAPTVAEMALAITQRRAKAADQADIDRMLAELEALSNEEAQSLLADDNAKVQEGMA